MLNPISMESTLAKSLIQDPLEDCPIQRMAEELKCPICQGLLNRAASLSCNHVFCSSCIVPSLEQNSSCPVCKMPVGPREALPTPHMDALVNIYRSMEVAAGISLFNSKLTAQSDATENANKENQEGFNCPDTLKRKAPGLPTATLKKAKSCGQNDHTKQVHSRKAASEAHNYQIKCVLTDPDRSDQTIAQCNSSSQDYHLISDNCAANLDMETNNFFSRDAESSRGTHHKAPRQLETHSICSKVKEASLSSLTHRLVFCSSEIDDAGKEQVAKFAGLIGAVVSDTWSKEVTHVIAATDENGAAKKTAKVLTGILEGKWIVKKDWIAACTKEGHPVKEDPFTVTHDIHGTHIGLKHNRAGAVKKARKLFKGRRFYFSGEFSPASKTDLEALVLATGGVVLHREPVVDDLEGPEVNPCIIVLYSVEFSEGVCITDRDVAVQHRYLKAKTLADAVQAQVEAHSWLLNSISACLL